MDKIWDKKDIREEKMTIQTIKRMLDACYQAKRIREMLPCAALRRDTFLYSFSGCDPDHGEGRGCCEDFRYQ